MMSENLIERAENPAEQAKLLQDHAAPLQASKTQASTGLVTVLMSPRRTPRNQLPIRSA